MPLATRLDRRSFMKIGATVGAGLMLPHTHASESGQNPVGGGHLLIRHATVLTMEPGSPALPDTDVLIRNGVITALGNNLTGAGAEIIDAEGMILIPGLVDAHWHLWNSILRNSSPAPGGDAFFKSQLAISRRFTPELAALGVRLGLAEAINSGITTINNWSHNLRDPQFARAELKVMAESGLRGRFWYGYPQTLDSQASMDFADILRVQAQLNATPHAKWDLGVAIRGPERTEPEVWVPEFAFVKAHRLPISTHISVTADMQKKKAVQQLVRRDVLGPSVQLVHATHVDAQDIASIARCGASVCLTPLTEMRVGYGLAPVDALHRAKIPVTLGIDTLVLSGNANAFMVMQTLLNLATGMSGNEQALTAREVLFWATQGGADAMGLGSLIGSITVGKRADLTLIDARRLGMAPVYDPFASVVQSATPADVDTVIADGRVLKRGGRIVGEDAAALAQEISRQVITFRE